MIDFFDVIYFSLNHPRCQFSLLVAMSICMEVYVVCCPLPMHFLKVFFSLGKPREAKNVFYIMILESIVQVEITLQSGFMLINSDFF